MTALTRSAPPRPTASGRQQLSRLSNTVKAGMLVLTLLVLSAVLADWLAYADPQAIRPRHRLTPPGDMYWFGTDILGRDIFSRVLHGGQMSMLVGFFVAAFSAFCGVLIGLCAAVSRVLDAVMMRIMDGVMAIPGILLAVALVALAGASLYTLVFAIALPEIPRVARLVRSVVLGAREEAYVQAAEGLGLPRYKILWRHILPNCVPPLVVQTTYIFAAAILTEAVLGFLGVGFPPEIPTWGNIMAEGRTVFQRAPWIILFPGICLSLTVLAVNILGDGLRDFLDPKLSNSTKVAT